MQPAAADRGGRWARALVAALLALAVMYLIVAAQHFHWDFRVYYRAAATWVGGGDPYARGYPVEIGFVAGPLPFVYPPVALAAFAPLTLLPESAAVLVWLGLELGALIALVRTWRRFAPVPLDARRGLFLLFAFNGALYAALASGNVALFEALALFVGFDALLRDRPGRFAALVVATGALKVLPLLWLGALLVWGGPRRGRVLGLALGGVALLAALTAVLAPAYLEAAAAQLDERRWTNPTTLAALRDLLERTELALSPLAVYAVSAAAILAITAARIARLRPPARTLVPFLFVVAALVLPRFKNYSYVELLPAALVAIQACGRPARIALVALLCVVLPWSYLLVASPTWCQALEHALPVSRFVWGYTPLAGAFTLWLVYLARVLPAASDERRRPPLNGDVAVRSRIHRARELGDRE